MMIYCSRCGEFINHFNISQDLGEFEFKEKYSHILKHIICRECYKKGPISLDKFNREKR